MRKVTDRLPLLALLTAISLVLFSQAFAQEATTPELTSPEWETATQLYFDRCAGCLGRNPLIVPTILES